MHRIDTPTAQKDKFGQGKNGFTNGDPATGRRATDLNSDMWDAVQEEVCTVIEAAGIPLSKGEHTQLHAAIGRLIDEQVKTRLEKNQNGADIPNKPLFLQNVGLEETINLAKNAVPATRRVNSKPLTGDITLWASDVGAISADAVGEITDNGTMASANTPGWWRVAVSNSDTVADFPTYPDGSKLYSYGYLFVEKIGEVWFQHYYAHMGANAKRQDWGTVPNTSRPWIVDYNTANKPTPENIGALSVNGGRLNGPLGIGTDNALGGNSIVLGDNDTGF
ncbi:phage tail protein, partial [Salmonella enterica subsp. enterica serovar Anatum]|nr:phage tail protein [Salmonella enterica subsp. enterica serovar Anatum]